MFKDLTPVQILLIILAIIVVIYLFRWLFCPRPVDRIIYQGSPPLETMNADLNPSYLNAMANRTALATRPEPAFTLYNFYSPNCGACKQFASSWQSAANKLSQISDQVSVQAIDATNPSNEDLTFYYNINAYPTILLVTPERNIEYTGDRSANDLHNFVANQIADHQNRY